jgi:uncharacterized membrane protein YeiH
MSRIRKAIVPLIVAVIGALVAWKGPGDPLSVGIIGIATALGVYAVPNKTEPA